MKRKWEEIFANDEAQKGLITKICKRLTKLNKLKKKSADLKIGRRPEQTFLQKKDIQMTNRHMKKCSTPFIIRQMQIKTIMRRSPWWFSG